MLIIAMRAPMGVLPDVKANLILAQSLHNQEILVHSLIHAGHAVIILK